jgi:hypothetical protein
MDAAASNVAERKDGTVKLEIAGFIGKLLGAETKNSSKTIPEFCTLIEYSTL